MSLLEFTVVTIEVDKMGMLFHFRSMCFWANLSQCFLHIEGSFARLVFINRCQFDLWKLYVTLLHL